VYALRDGLLHTTGGSVLQITIWAKLTAYSWGGGDDSLLGESTGESQEERRGESTGGDSMGARLEGKKVKGPQLTAVPKDAKGGSQLYANLFLNPREATSYNISEWHPYTLVITVSEATVHARHPCE
jgi:hypothetical protein